MIQSPEAGASQSSSQHPSLTYFTFWDMDDTSVDLKNNLIKNPHLLLPIMLYQTFAPNQHVGIMTNRTPEDLETDYTVKQYITDLSRFGIIVPTSQVIFGGGINNRQSNNELHELSAAMEVICKQLRSLQLTAGPTLSAKILGSDEKSYFDQMLNAKFSGKNFQINAFLNSAFNEQTKEFHFEKGQCPQEGLVVCLVDDLEKIAGVASLLGERFIGIKAARGGKPPAELDYPIEDDDFYQDEYLIEVANKIGLTSYASQLLSAGQLEHKNAMLQMAALLYAWQVLPQQVNIKHFMTLAKLLSSVQLEQMAQLLTYIHEHANEHPQAHYRSVNKVAKLLRHLANEAFLETAAEMLCSLKQKILKLSVSEGPIAEEETIPESSKPKKSLGALFKSRSVANSLKPPVRTIITERTQELAHLKQEEQALLARVAGFLDSPDLKLASRAQQVLGPIVASGAVVLSPIGPSFSSPVSSSSTALSIPPHAPTSPLFPALSRHRLSSASPTSSSSLPVLTSRTVVSDPLPLSVPPDVDEGNLDPNAAPKPKEDKRLEM